jgi:hypothetical protein
MDMNIRDCVRNFVLVTLIYFALTVLFTSSSTWA